MLAYAHAVIVLRDLREINVDDELTTMIMITVLAVAASR